MTISLSEDDDVPLDALIAKKFPESVVTEKAKNTSNINNNGNKDTGASKEPLVPLADPDAQPPVIPYADPDAKKVMNLSEIQRIKNSIMKNHVEKEISKTEI